MASATDSMLGITSATTVRPRIYYIGIGSTSAPADNALEWFIQRHTAAGTATSVTPTALDPGDPASTTASGENHTAEPTYTSAAILWRLALNQRSSHSIILDPMGALVCPASANNGATLYPVHASATPDVSGCLHFEE